MSAANDMILDLKAPHQVYRTKDGEKVPGVTTVLQQLNKPAIPYWTGCEEREGILRTMGSTRAWTRQELRLQLPINSKTGKPVLFAETKRDKAADVGTVAHAMVEAWHLGKTLSRQGIEDALYESALVPFGRFKQWWGDSGLTLLHAELQMVSESWRVGGTADQIGRDRQGRVVLWDTKTGKPWYEGRPYREQIAQAVAYAQMYQEVHGEVVEEISIARIGKTAGDNGDLYHLSKDEVYAGLGRWLAALAAHRSTKDFDLIYKER